MNLLVRIHTVCKEFVMVCRAERFKQLIKEKLLNRVYTYRMYITIVYLDRFQIGTAQAKKCLRACAKCADSHHPAHAQSPIRAITSSLIHSAVFNVSVCEQRRCRSEAVLPASILHKSIAGRYRPVCYPDGPITARYRFM